MEQGNREQLTIRELMADPLLRQYASRNFDKEILKKQMQDRTLFYTDLDEYAQMDMEELVTTAFTHSLAQEVGEDSVVKTQEAINQIQAQGTAEGAELPRIRLLINPNATEARIILTKPGEGEKPPTLAEMKQVLEDAGVVRGVQSKYLERLAECPVYEHRFKVAVGKAPVDGVDGRAVFHFNTAVDLSPRIGEDGIADYKSLDYVKNVKAGELLCEMIPPEAGEDGFTVFGEVLKGKRGKAVDIKHGLNTSISEDGREIYATCDGQASLRGDKLLVSRVLTVENVDASTGNILFVGTVQVDGDVLGGFTIRAGGDITVKGIVEDAVLAAGGNIVLCSGMKGRSTGVLDAGGSIRTFFIENAKIKARESVYADAIINSTVECGERVSLSGERGCLIGGKCMAGREVSALKIGNEAGIATSVILGDVESLAEQKARAELKIARYEQVLKKIRQMVELTAVDGREEPQFQVLLSRVVIIKQRLERAVSRLRREYLDESSRSSSRTVAARETLYQNVLLTIDGVNYRSRNVQCGCEAFKLNGQIRLSTYR